MTRRFPASRPGEDRFDELTRDPALDALVADARSEPVEVDRAALETTLAVFRVAAAPPTVEAETGPRPARRRRLVEAVAATTLATKVLLGVGTAVALGGIGVAVTETVQHRSPTPPATTAPVTPPPSTDAPSGTDSGGPPSGSTTASPTVSPTSTVTDTASRGASGSATPSGTTSPTGSGSPGSGTPSSSSSATPRDATPTASSPSTADK